MRKNKTPRVVVKELIVKWRDQLDLDLDSQSEVYRDNEGNKITRVQWRKLVRNKLYKLCEELSVLECEAGMVNLEE